MNSSDRYTAILLVNGVEMNAEAGSSRGTLLKRMKQTTGLYAERGRVIDFDPRRTTSLRIEINDIHSDRSWQYEWRNQGDELFGSRFGGKAPRSAWYDLDKDY